MTLSKWKICNKMTLVDLTTFSISKTKISDKGRKNPPSLYCVATLFSLCFHFVFSAKDERKQSEWSEQCFLKHKTFLIYRRHLTGAQDTNELKRMYLYFLSNLQKYEPILKKKSKNVSCLNKRSNEMVTILFPTYIS